MLTIMLVDGERKTPEKVALLEQRGLSTAFTLSGASSEEIAAAIERLLQAERILQLNKEEIYFLKEESTGPFTPRNELESLYHVHQLILDSRNAPEASTCRTENLEGSRVQDHANNLNQSFHPLISKNELVKAHRGNIDPNRLINEAGSGQEIWEAARSEMERRLIAYGGETGQEGSGEECTGAAERELLMWAEANGVVSNVEAAVFPSTGRGAAAKKDLSVGETVLKVPEAMIISASTAMASDMAQTFSQVASLDEDTIALLWSMRERHLAASHWAPFFRSLPSAFGTGLSFGEEALRELEGTPACEQIMAAQEHLKSQYATLFPALSTSFSTVFSDEIYTWANFLWAAELWYSYGVKVQFSDGSIRTALVPLVSLLNHSVYPHVTHFSCVDPKSRALHLPAMRPCSEGQQCFLSYGTLQSSDLLTFYGFTVDKNPCDAVQMDLELPEEDELLPAKQAMYSKWNLGLSHSLRADGIPPELHGALRVLLMDSEEMNAYKGDPRKDKVSNTNEAAVLETLLATVDALLDAGQSRPEVELSGQDGIDSITSALEEEHTRPRKSGGILEEQLSSNVLKELTERTVAAARTYRQQQNGFLAEIRKGCLSLLHTNELEE